MNKSTKRNNVDPTVLGGYKQDNIPKVTFESKRCIVLCESRIKNLYGLINKEIEDACTPERPLDEEKIEIWSREIDQMCNEVSLMSVTNLDDLQAKISLNCFLMSQSMMDPDAMTFCRNNIISAVHQFKEAHAMTPFFKTG